MTAATNPTPEAVRTQLKRILKSKAFKGSDKQRNFLNFVVNESLDGRASQLKGYTIAVSVYGRSETFDPQVDPIVRVEAGRLRRALDRYYLTAGSDDPVLITIPKGAYVPAFRTVYRANPANDSERRETQRRTTLARPSIAVMPLLNLTGYPSNDYFVDGLTEEFTTELARYQDFRVIASQSTIRYKGEKADAQSIGRNLKVRFLLSGSVRKDSDTVKITVRLVDTGSGVQIWGENYKRELSASNLI